MTDPLERLNAEARADDEAPTEAVATPVRVELQPAVATDPSPSEQIEGAPTVTEQPAARPRARTARPSPTPRASSPYAIVETGGKQYRVSVGDSLAVEKLPVEAGDELILDRVLLLSGNGTTRVGTPVVPGAAVTARVEDHYRGDKIVVFKYKAKKRYRRRMGHRQSLSRLTITGITG